jgi:organic radical activating enzyme
MKFNPQAPEKRATGDGTVIAVHSIFHTIQGEGPFAGTPAVFVRLAGCNLQCPMCDTEYTSRTDMSPSDIEDAICEVLPPLVSPHRMLVVVTGGEPFRQPIGMFVRYLLHRGYRVQIETNGTLIQHPFPFFHDNVTIVCSPKTGSVHRELLPHIKAFKYVATAASLLHSHDGLPMTALDHPSAPHLFRKPADHPAEVYLQPVDERHIQDNYKNQAAVVKACLTYGHRLCLQVHKLIGVD